MARTNLTTGYVISYGGCFGAFDIDGALLDYTLTKYEAIAIVNGPRYGAGKVRMAIIAEMKPSIMEVSAINQYDYDELVEWAQLLSL